VAPPGTGTGSAASSGVLPCNDVTTAVNRSPAYVDHVSPVNEMKASPIVSHTAVVACHPRIRARPGGAPTGGRTSSRRRARRRPIQRASPPTTNTGSQLAAVSE
jgi:hypothetical protein